MRRIGKFMIKICFSCTFEEISGILIATAADIDEEGCPF